MGVEISNVPHFIAIALVRGPVIKWFHDYYKLPLDLELPPGDTLFLRGET
jgi:hypothetical protein